MKGKFRTKMGEVADQKWLSNKIVIGIIALIATATWGVSNYIKGFEMIDKDICLKIALIEKDISSLNKKVDIIVNYIKQEKGATGKNFPIELTDKNRKTEKGNLLTVISQTD